MSRLIMPRAVVTVCLLVGSLGLCYPCRGSEFEVTVWCHVNEAAKGRLSPIYEIQVATSKDVGVPIGGFREDMPAEYVVDHLKTVLARRGYRGPSEGKNADLVLVCQWGFADPGSRDLDSRAQANGAERRAMLTLVGGMGLTANASEAERQQVIAAALEPRYFVVLSAYQREGFELAGGRILFWRSFMSVPTDRLTLSDAVPLLLSIGQGTFGVHTPVPQRSTVQLKGKFRPWPF